MKRMRAGRLSLYIEPRDAWVGAYVAATAIYVCLLPFLVLRWQRNLTDPLDSAMHSVWLHGNWHWLTRDMTTEEREAAADAVDRYSAKLNADAPDLKVRSIERWWRH